MGKKKTPTRKPAKRAGKASKPRKATKAPENMSYEELMKFQFALLKKKEELCPELRPFLVLDEMFPMIHHPLFITMDFSEGRFAYVNWFYTQKLKQVKQAIAEGNWSKYVFAHASGYQLGAFEEVAHHLTDEAYWKLLGQVYVLCENTHQYAKALRRTLTSDRPQREKIMDAKERAFFRKATEPVITIYRGYAHNNERRDGVGRSTNGTGGVVWSEIRWRARKWCERLA